MNTYPEISSEVKDTISNRYGLNILDSVVFDNVSDMVKRINDEATATKRPILKNTPSLFVEDDKTDFEVIPQYSLPPLKTIERYLDLFSPKGGVLHICHGHDQFTLPFHKLMRSRGHFVAACPPSNISLASEMIRQADITFVVMHAKHFSSFYKDLNSRGLSVSTVVLYAGIYDLPFGSEEVVETNVLRDIHIFPGHPVLYQSFALLGKTDTFHLDDRYLWELGEEATYITGVESSALPVVRFMLPFTLKKIDSLTKEPAFILTPC